MPSKSNFDLAIGRTTYLIVARVVALTLVVTLAELPPRLIYAQSRGFEPHPKFEVASVKPFDISKLD